MLTLATGQKSKSIRASAVAQRGVTLVELLVVLTMIALLASIVVLSTPPAQSDAMKSAEQFAARIDFASQEAITSGRVIGVIAQPDGYQFYSYDRGVWTELAEKILGAEAFSSTIAVDLELAESARKNEPQDMLRESKRDNEIPPRPKIIFAPTGETTPFSVVFADRRNQYRVTLSDSGAVQLSKENVQQ